MYKIIETFEFEKLFAPCHKAQQTFLLTFRCFIFILLFEGYNKMFKF